MRPAARLILLLLAVLAPLPARAVEAPPATPAPTAPPTATLAALAPQPRPPEPSNPATGICRMIEAAARDAALDAHFFARLIWRESLFDPTAVSPKGARGIAQFMPDTAKLRGLDDAFDPTKALPASARYLADLTRTFGNLGLAAAAYNGGEARLTRYVTGGTLPDETRAYVAAITGHSAQAWRDAPPATLDLTLKPGATFEDGCLALAATRGRRETTAEPPPPPWGIVIASNRDRDAASRQVARLRNRHALLAGETVHYGRARRLGMSRGLLVAQVGRDSRAEAETFCARLRASGGDCIVLRN